MTNQNLEEFNLMCDEFEDKLRKHVSSKSRVSGIKNKIKWHLKKRWIYSFYAFIRCSLFNRYPCSS